MKRNGFTLVEMLIALGIFGMLTAAGVALLSFSVRTQDMADRRLAQVADIRRAAALLTADLGQAAARAHRDENGAARPVFEGAGGGEGLLLGFVRRGWENPDAAPRSSLQRVDYRLAGGRIERVGYAHVDGGAVAARVPVLDGVRTVRLRYRDGEGNWRDRWDPEDEAQLPRAVEVVTDSEVHGTVRQLFLVGDSG